MANVVFLNRYFFPDHSATSQLLADLAFYLAGEGHVVHVITSRQRYDEPGASLASREMVRGVTVHRVWTSRFGRGNLFGRAFDYFSFYLSAGWRGMRVIRPGDVVVAMTDPPMLSLAAAPLARLKPAISVNWIQDLFPEVAGVVGMAWAQGPVGRMLAAARDWSFRCAASNIVVCDAMASYLISRGVSPQQVTVIPNWADGDGIRPVDAAKNSLRKEWGVDGKFVIGYSGNMGRVHEFDTIIGAAEALTYDDRIVFLFIGGGAQRDMVERRARERGLSNLRFQPYQPRENLGESLSVPDVHMVSQLPAAEGYVFPSKFYGILAAGRPVIFVGQRDGEIARLIAQHRLGAAIEIGQSDALVALIRSWVAAPESVVDIGARSRRIFEQHYSAKIALAKWARALLDIIARR